MIFPMISSLLLIVAIVCFLNLTPQQITEDLMRLTTPKVTLREKARNMRAGKKKKSLGSKLAYTQTALAAMGQENKFALVCCASLVLFAAGAVVAVLIDNIFLLPALSVAFALIPFIYVRNSLSQYEKHIKTDLETTLSTITTSYIRNEDIILAVRENLDYIKPPLRACFNAFIGDAVAVSSSVKQALRNLKEKVDDDIFREWCDALIRCQDDRALVDTLHPIVAKLTDVRVVNSELSTMMAAVRTEYYTMVGLVVGNIPLLYVLNKDWFHTLIYETPGKIVLGICGAVIIVTYMFLLKFTKPVEYKA